MIRDSCIFFLQPWSPPFESKTGVFTPPSESLPLPRGSPYLHSTKFLNCIQPTMEEGPMTDDVLQSIFTSDQDMYPAPLTFERLRTWVAARPDLSRCFYIPRSGSGHGEDILQPAGVIIVLPVEGKFWQNLLNGSLKETEIDAATMFPCDSDSGVEVGLHVFHLEKFERRVRGFAHAALRSVLEVAEKTWKVLGCSALTATADGRRCFEGMRFEPTGYEEFWIARNDGVELVTVIPGGNRTGRDEEDSSIKARAQMVVRYSPTTHSYPSCPPDFS
ncbi:hypothetical protein MVEN_00748300 [Mycena venus]|uniref:Uncharacterized protein n=1 Tax=Mycena venus TaxID=2733690 RepID=A0A8H6YK69_9AGAR|nr:hypothetical protein MVEN_00748300 [Mycena venus]